MLCVCSALCMHILYIFTTCRCSPGTIVAQIFGADGRAWRNNNMQTCPGGHAFAHMNERGIEANRRESNKNVFLCILFSYIDAFRCSLLFSSLFLFFCCCCSIEVALRKTLVVFFFFWHSTRYLVCVCDAAQDSARAEVCAIPRWTWHIRALHVWIVRDNNEYIRNIRIFECILRISIYNTGIEWKGQINICENSGRKNRDFVLLVVFLWSK